MIQEWLRNNEKKITRGMSILVVILVLTIVVFKIAFLDNNNRGGNAFADTTHPEDVVEEDTDNSNSINPINPDNPFIPFNPFEDSIFWGNGNTTQAAEESPGDGAAFEEEDALEENKSDSSDKNSSTEAKNPEQDDTPPKTEANQDTTENIGLPPKAPNQDGEWGKPIPN
ncbi:MAG: hypothetical protein ACI4GZ_01340 [Ruminococcus sp.]